MILRVSTTCCFLPAVFLCLSDQEDSPYLSPISTCFLPPVTQLSRWHRTTFLLLRENPINEERFSPVSMVHLSRWVGTAESSPFPIL